MNKVDLPSWYDELVKDPSGIYQVTNQIQTVSNRLRTTGVTEEQMPVLFSNIFEVLLVWTGNTYVGRDKETKLKKAFQKFFCALYDLLLVLRDIPFDEYRELADNALYQGKLYRYLGYGDIDGDISRKVEPLYNEIYVSWSKNKHNDYLRTKLHGTITVLECNVVSPYFGIDLEPFGVVRGDEGEVVFPTIESTITEISCK